VKLINVIGIPVILTILITIVIFVVAIFLATRVVSEIQDRGLKNIVEEVWEGPDIVD